MDCALEGRLGALRVGLLLLVAVAVGVADEVLKLRVRGLLVGELLDARARLVELGSNHAEVDEGVGMAGVEPHGPPKTFNRLGQLALGLVREPQIVQRVSEIRIEPQGPAVTFARLGHLPQVLENISQVVMGFEEIGLDLNRFRKDIESEIVEQRILLDRQRGAWIGVNATPTVFLNGRELQFENLDTDRLRRLISDELSKSK